MGVADQIGPFADTEFKCEASTCCGVGNDWNEGGHTQ